MRTMIQIAKIQLAKLFYSPIAWLIFIVVFIQTGFVFTDLIDFFETRQRQSTPFPILTEHIFTFTTGSKTGIFYVLSKNLYLYLPLLTMGLISTELSSGSIKLLYSAPIKIRHLILGKYIAMVIFSLLLISCLWLFVLPGTILIAEFDYGVVASASVGLFLLSCTYTAIGLFISSFSSYQIVVAVVTFVLLTLLNFIGNLWQTTPYLSEVAFWLALPDRAKDFIEGLFKSQNLVYFLLIISFFIAITILRLHFNRHKVNRLKQVTTYVLFVIFVLLVGFFSSIPSFRWYFDLTASDRKTLTKNSQEIIKDMTEGPLTMTIYANILDHNVYSALPRNKNKDKREFEDYQRFKHDMEFRYIYFYDSVDNPGLYENNEGLNLDQIAKKTASSYGLDFEQVLSPYEISQLVDLKEEENQYVRQLAYQGKSTFLRMFDSFWHYPTELQISAALKRLVVRAPVIAFSVGHNERSFKLNKDGDYKQAFSLRHDNNVSLLNLGFDLREISLATQELSSDIDVLVIADPKKQFEQVEIDKILEYINDGGNLLLTVEPNHLLSLEPILEHLGLKQIPGQLAQNNAGEYEDSFILAEYAQVAKLPQSGFIEDYVVKFKRPITMPGASAWSYHKAANDFIIDPLIVAKDIKVDSLASYSTELTIALTLSRNLKNRQQRIIISGEADFISTKEINRKNLRTANDKGLVPAMFHWLSNGKFPINVQRIPGKDNHLNLASKEGQTVKILKIIYMGLFPGLLAMIGAYVLFSRKRR